MRPPRSISGTQFRIEEGEVLERIRELAQNIAEKYPTERLTVLCIEKGALVSAAILEEELRKLKKSPVMFATIGVRSYIDGQPGKAQLYNVPSPHLTRKRKIIIYDGIVDTGRTMQAVINFLRDIPGYLPNTADGAALLVKGNPPKYMEENFIGFLLDRDAEFVAGMGMDFDQSMRDETSIFTLSEEQKNAFRAASGTVVERHAVVEAIAKTHKKP